MTFRYPLGIGNEVALRRKKFIRLKFKPEGKVLNNNMKNPFRKYMIGF